MTKKIITALFLFVMQIPAFCYEDCIITNNSKLTDIKIEDNSIIDVYPLTTIMNDKKILIVHPLKTGTTRFCVLKNGKDLVLFNVEVTETETLIDEVRGFDILPLDTPEGVYNFELDRPPVIKEFSGGNAEWMN